MRAASALGLAAGAVAFTPPASAQSSPARAAETIAFNLPAQDLNTALLAFADRAGLQLVYDARLVEGLNTAPLIGAFSVRDGLTRLLAGTGLDFRFSGADTVSLYRVAAVADGDGPIRTGPVTVQARADADPSDQPFVTPGSSAYISREQIERIQPSSPGDIFKEVPGVLSGASNDGTSINVNIRSSQGLNRVRTMVEGTQQESSGYQGYAGADQRTYLDPELIGGVEITKGPGDGPYSTGTTAGAVNVRLLDADDLIKEGRNFGFRVRGGLAGNGTAPRFLDEPIFDREADTSLLSDDNAILADDNWFYSLAGGYSTDRFDVVVAYTQRREGNYFAGQNGPTTWTGRRENDGVNSGGPVIGGIFSRIEPGQEVPNTSEQTESILLKGTLRFNDGQSLEAGLTRYDSAFGQVFPSFLAFIAPQQYELNEVVSNRYWLRYKWESDSDLINLQANLWRTTADESGEIGQGPQANEAWGAELWNASFFDTGLGGLTLTYGAEYTRSEAVIDMFEPVRGTQFTLGEPSREVEGEIAPPFDGARKVYGAYLNAVFQPTDWLTLNAGIRYDGFDAESTRIEEVFDVDNSAALQRNRDVEDAFIRDDIEEALRLLNIPLDTLLDGYQGDVLVPNDSSGERFSPHAGITIEPVDGLQIFGRYSEGFRALSLVELGQAFAAPVVVNPDLEPEVVKTWEAGLNYLKDGLLFENDAFRIRLVYFNNDYGDTFSARVGRTPSRPQIGRAFFYTNIPDVEVSGYEISLFYDAGRVFADLNFTGFDAIFDPDTVIGIQSSIQQPEYAGTLTVGTRWFDQKLELGGRLNVFGELPLEGGLFRDDSIFTERVYYWSAQEIVDLFGSYRFNDIVSVGFSVENLTNRFYMPPLYVSQIPAPGRTVRVNTTLQF